MKTKTISTSRVRPRNPPGTHQEAPLPAIDSWYTYRRSLVVIYFFPSAAEPSRSSLGSDLLNSLSTTLDVFPQLAGRIQARTIETKAPDGTVLEVKRPKLVWGGGETPTPDDGVEYILAEASVDLEELLPPTDAEHRGFMWDRSGSPLEKLFPKAPSSEALVRVQVTYVQCGGFSIAIDMDHGIADAHVVGLFMQYWSAIFSKRPISNLPRVHFRPDLVAQQVEEKHGNPDEMLQLASRLVVRRPLVRDHHESPASSLAPPVRGSLWRNGMLHLPVARYERIVRDITSAAGTRVTDQVAIASFLWAALNRARGRGVDLHMAVSLRGTLNIPEGTLGSPFVAAMLRCGARSTDAVGLAPIIMRTLSQYDEEAMRSIAYQAALEDSPDGSHRPQGKAESMVFTSAAQSGWDAVTFGPHRPVFMAPLLPHGNLFVIVESLNDSREVGATHREWYAGGVNIFFKVSEEIYEALSSDPAFLDFVQLRDV